MDNREIASLLEEIGDLMEILNENSFKVQSYRRAAESIRGLPEDLTAIRETDGLESIPHIGKTIATKLSQLLDTGRMEYHDELKAQVPPGLLEMLRIPGVGPKKVALVWRERGIGSIDELEAAATGRHLRDLPGMGAKSEEKILHAIGVYRQGTERALLSDLLPVAEGIVAALKELPEVIDAAYAGSARRMKETVGDLDILATSTAPAAVTEAFKHRPEIREIILSGDTKTSALLEGGRQVDLRVVPPESYGAALVYFTGSKEHNINIRERARRMGLTINEYAVSRLLADGQEGERVAGATEDEVYRAIGLPWIPPEIREDRGEIEAAEAGTLPVLLELDDIRSDLQMHSEWSDGTHPIEKVAAAARAMGYEYVALTDHSVSLMVAHGLSPEKLAARREEIDELNAGFEQAGESFRVLAGSEVDIKPDGNLDYAPEVLATLDLVLASIHQGFTDDKARMTDRILKALATGQVDIFCHPTGRVLNGRPGYPVDMEALVEAAIEFDVALEVNAFPDRLDLADTNVRLAMERGARLTINTDAHSPAHLQYMRYGVATARRGWATKEAVINTWPLKKLLKWRKDRGRKTK